MSSTDVLRQVLCPLAATGQSHGDGALDTQPGHAQAHAECADGHVLRPACDAGLIITEGTSPSPNGLGYPRIPWLFDVEQVQAWKATTTAAHAQGGKIFAQSMHCGRVAHIDNLPTGAEVLGPRSDVCPGEMYTDALGMQPHSPPRAMLDPDIAHSIDEHVTAAKLAPDSGFDGVELHGANGYLIEQSLNPLVNQRIDGYGGSMECLNRLVPEIARATVAAIGQDRVGIRLSPYGVFNGTATFPEVQAQYLALVHSLSALGLLYVHLVDHSSMGAPRFCRSSGVEPKIVARLAQ